MIERAPRLEGRDLAGLATAVQDDVDAAGIGFASADGDPRFRVDPVPRLFDHAEWTALAAGLRQRVRALDAFLADAYGERRIVSEGVVPARVIDSADLYETALRGVPVAGRLWIGIAGLDVVRDRHGELLVLEDNLRTPSGPAYTVAARRAVLRHVGADGGPQPLALDGLADMLRAVLAAAAPDGVAEPRAAVLTDGPENSAHWEHGWLAEALGIPLVEPGDLTVRDGRLHAARAGRIDVVYRRTNDDVLDTDVGAALREPVLRRRLGVVNAFGTGLADDKLVHAYVEDMIRFHLGEEPLVRSVRTYDPQRPEILAEALDRLHELVIKPRAEAGGEGVVIGPHAEPADVDAARDRLRADPAGYVVQEVVELSEHPTVIDGALAPRHVDLRPFVFNAGDAVHVLPGGLTRVAFDAGALVVNSSQNGGVKDTWVMPPA